MRSLLIFIDETGDEDFSDPKNPTFGRGGCGALMPEYKRRIAKPWRRRVKPYLPENRPSGG